MAANVGGGAILFILDWTLLQCIYLFTMNNKCFFFIQMLLCGLLFAISVGQKKA